MKIRNSITYYLSALVIIAAIHCFPRYERVLFWTGCAVLVAMAIGFSVLEELERRK